MDRTVRIQLHPTPEQAIALQETLQQFTEAFNTVCAYGWQRHEKNGIRLHHATYRSTKEACPGLVSDLLIQARVKANEALKSAFTWKAKHERAYQKRVAKARKRGKPIPAFKPVRCPQSISCAVRYNVHTYSLKWESQTVRLSTTQGKMSLPFTVPALCQHYIGYKVATADLLYRKGKFWLHVVVDVPAPTVEKSSIVIGIDLGLNHPAVTSTRQFLGSPHWKEVDHRAFRLRRQLQSNGSKSAKRHLKKLSKKQQRFHRDCDHVLSKRIIQTAPRHTSQTCSRCGFQHRANRRTQSLFLCKSCRYTLNADYNASKNIRDKYLASVGTSFASGLPSSNLSQPPSGESQALMPLG
jgi:putative transposase